MSIKINTWRDPYDAGFNTIKPRQIEIHPGLTVLVGCNGAGKTTLLFNIKEKLKEQNIPVHSFDNLQDGGIGAGGSLCVGYKEFDGDDIELGALLVSASEGETIKINIKRQSTLYKEFINTGYFKDRFYKFNKAFFDKLHEDITDNRRVLLFDATDSGMSIDAVCELKIFFKSFIDYAKENGIELYVIISANEYELARNEQCFDVNEGKYLTFSDYEDYRNFIIKSRQKKEKRMDKQIVWNEKQKQKELLKYEQLKLKTNEKIKLIKDKANSENRELTYLEKSKIDSYKYDLDYFARNCRFNDFSKDR